MKQVLIIICLLFMFSCNENKKEEKKVIEKKVVRNQTNIINWEDSWKLGEGSVDGFKSFGNENKSRRIKGLDIDSKETVMWECIADTITSWDGGFLSKIKEIDKTSPYLFVAWVKKTNNNSARIYYAFDSVEEVTGEYVRNGNFIGAGSTLPELDVWYTLVGYIYPENHKDNIEAKVKSGLYFEGQKIQEGRDFKWSEQTIETNLRVVQVESKFDKENLIISNPQLYKVDGTEPKLYNLL